MNTIPTANMMSLVGGVGRHREDHELKNQTEQSAAEHSRCVQAIPFFSSLISMPRTKMPPFIDEKPLTSIGQSVKNKSN